MSEDLELAARVHYSFLPGDYDDGHLSVAVALRPLYMIGGDYCSILPLDEKRVLVCTCDAVGHGISAALFAARVNTYVLTHARIGLSPCDLMTGLNAYLCNRLGGTGMYTSFFALCFDFEDGDLSLAGAAHPPVLELSPRTMTCHQWPSRFTYLGITDPMPLDCGLDRIPLEPGQRFLLYSDGLTEAENADKHPFGIERLISAFTENIALSGQDLNSAIIGQAESFTGDGFDDDILLLSIEVR